MRDKAYRTFASTLACSVLSDISHSTMARAQQRALAIGVFVLLSQVGDVNPSYPLSHSLF